MALSRFPSPMDNLPVSHSEKIQIKQGERWLLMGTSGSGKTTGAKMIDKQLFRVYSQTKHYILDSQGMGDFDTYSGIIRTNKSPDVIKKKDTYQVWQPLLLDPEQIERWLEQIFNRPPAVLMIDELYVLKYKGAQNYSDMYATLQCAGRGRDITTITHTQKLAKIPPAAYEQATHRLGFYMDGLYNRSIRSELLKSEKVPNPVDTFGFYYQHVNGRGNPPYYRDIYEFLGGKT